MDQMEDLQSLNQPVIPCCWWGTPCKPASATSHCGVPWIKENQAIDSTSQIKTTQPYTKHVGGSIGHVGRVGSVWGSSKTTFLMAIHSKTCWIAHSDDGPDAKKLGNHHCLSIWDKINVERAPMNMAKEPCKNSNEEKWMRS
jgi:hypothetical protein